MVLWSGVGSEDCGGSVLGRGVPGLTAASDAGTSLLAVPRCLFPALGPECCGAERIARVAGGVVWVKKAVALRRRGSWHWRARLRSRACSRLRGS